MKTRNPPHHLTVRWILGSTSSGVVVIQDAGPTLMCDTQSLFVGVLRANVALQEVLHCRKLGTLGVHGESCCNLQTSILMGDGRRCGGHR